MVHMRWCLCSNVRDDERPPDELTQQLQQLQQLQVQHRQEPAHQAQTAMPIAGTAGGPASHQQPSVVSRLLGNVRRIPATLRKTGSNSTHGSSTPGNGPSKQRGRRRRSRMLEDDVVSQAAARYLELFTGHIAKSPASSFLEESSDPPKAGAGGDDGGALDLEPLDQDGVHPPRTSLVTVATIVDSIMPTVRESGGSGGESGANSDSIATAATTAAAAAAAAPPQPPSASSASSRYAARGDAHQLLHGSTGGGSGATRDGGGSSGGGGGVGTSGGSPRTGTGNNSVGFSSYVGGGTGNNSGTIALGSLATSGSLSALPQQYSTDGAASSGSQVPLVGPSGAGSLQGTAKSSPRGGATAPPSKSFNLRDHQLLSFLLRGRDDGSSGGASVGGPPPEAEGSGGASAADAAAGASNSAAAARDWQDVQALRKVSGSSPGSSTRSSPQFHSRPVSPHALLPLSNSVRLIANLTSDSGGSQSSVSTARRSASQQPLATRSNRSSHEADANGPSPENSGLDNGRHARRYNDSTVSQQGDANTLTWPGSSHGSATVPPNSGYIGGRNHRAPYGSSSSSALPVRPANYPRASQAMIRHGSTIFFHGNNDIEVTGLPISQLTSFKTSRSTDLLNVTTSPSGSETSGTSGTFRTASATAPQPQQLSGQLSAGAYSRPRFASAYARSTSATKEQAPSRLHTQSHSNQPLPTYASSAGALQAASPGRRAGQPTAVTGTSLQQLDSRSMTDLSSSQGQLSSQERTSPTGGDGGGTELASQEAMARHANLGLQLTGTGGTGPHGHDSNKLNLLERHLSEAGGVFSDSLLQMSPEAALGSPSRSGGNVVRGGPSKPSSWEAKVAGGTFALRPSLLPDNSSTLQHLATPASARGMALVLSGGDDDPTLHASGGMCSGSDFDSEEEVHYDSDEEVGPDAQPQCRYDGFSILGGDQSEPSRGAELRQQRRSAAPAAMAATAAAAAAAAAAPSSSSSSSHGKKLTKSRSAAHARGLNEPSVGGRHGGPSHRKSPVLRALGRTKE